MGSLRFPVVAVYTPSRSAATDLSARESIRDPKEDGTVLRHSQPTDHNAIRVQTARTVQRVANSQTPNAMIMVALAASKPRPTCWRR
jgi:hypothetical protein